MMAWKLFDAERSTDTHAVLLYHGLSGSKSLIRGQWYKAAERWVIDGSNQEPYLSGFHCFRFYSEAERYAERFTRPVTVEAVRTRGRRRVKPTNSHVLLVPEIVVEA